MEGSRQHRRKPHTTLRLVLSIVASGFVGSGADEVWHAVFAMAPVVYTRLAGNVSVHSVSTEPMGSPLPRPTESDHGVAQTQSDK